MNEYHFFTDLEQSRKLAEILPPESADMWYDSRYKEPHIGNYTQEMQCREDKDYRKNQSKAVGFCLCPCWSLVALIKALPKKPCREYNLVISEKPPYFAFDDLALNVHEDYDGTDSIDACVNMILQLHNKGLLQ